MTYATADGGHTWRQDSQLSYDPSFEEAAPQSEHGSPSLLSASNRSLTPGRSSAKSQRDGSASRGGGASGTSRFGPSGSHWQRLDASECGAAWQAAHTPLVHDGLSHALLAHTANGERHATLSTAEWTRMGVDGLSWTSFVCARGEFFVPSAAHETAHARSSSSRTPRTPLQRASAELSRISLLSVHFVVRLRRPAALATPTRGVAHRRRQRSGQQEPRRASQEAGVATDDAGCAGGSAAEADCQESGHGERRC
jgi:hypothetical protein